MSARVKKWGPLLLAILLIAGIYAWLHGALGTQPFAHSDYDSYTLQALRWREGAFSLGQDYPHLELAIFEGDWYVSFPPVPSVVQFFLTFLFGRNTPDGLLVKLYALSAFVLLYAYFVNSRRMKPVAAVLWSVLAVYATDMFSITLDGGVWYQAQTLNFLLLTGAFCAMVKKRPTLSCVLYALAVGCRPFSVLFGPVLLTVYWVSARPENRLRRLIPGVCAGLAIAGAYAWYNFVRFGNPLEFGHNYLPEFVRVETGQFSLAYLGKNFRQFLFGLPFSWQNGALQVEKFGFSMFLCNPILLCLPVWAACDGFRRTFSPRKQVVVALFCAHLFCLMLHKSFGGFQFGARYTLELIPYCVAYLHLARRHSPVVLEDCLCLYGVGFNALGAWLINR